MDRKRQKLSLGNKNEEKDDLVTRLTSLEKVLANNETELKLKNTENVDLRKRVTLLEKELEEKEDLQKRVRKLEQELVEKEDLQKRVKTLEQELAEKEAQLNLSNIEKEDLARKLTALQQEHLNNEVEQNLIEKRDISNFPNEVIIEIFKHLTQNELGQIARVCKRWDELTRSTVLWQKVNVVFHYSHRSQNDIFNFFVNRLPCSSTSVKVEFLEIQNWIQPLDFQKLCLTLQEKCPDLQQLILCNSKLSNTHPSIVDLCSQFLPNVTTLAFWFSKLLDCVAPVQYTGTSEITVLDLSGLSGIKHFSKAVFSRMPHLKKMNLTCTHIKDSWFKKEISFLSQLELLNLGDTNVGYRAFRAIKNHGLNLKKLYMCWTLLDDDDLRFDTSTFPQLETICLNWCDNVTEEGVVSLVQSCPSLKNIHVNHFVVLSYRRHPFVAANPCKIGIVKHIGCYEHDETFY